MCVQYVCVGVEFCPLQYFVIYDKLGLKCDVYFLNANNLRSLTTQKEFIDLHTHTPFPDLKEV